MGQSCSVVVQFKPCQDCAVLAVRDPLEFCPTGPRPGQRYPAPEQLERSTPQVTDEVEQTEATPQLSTPLLNESIKQKLLRRDSSFRVGQSGYSTKFPPLVPKRPGVRGAICLILFIVTLTLCLTTFQPWLAVLGLPSDKLLKYVSIPILSTLFTYFHIWLALYMTFYPLKFVGRLQIPDTNVGCGWQGIIPSKAGKMARTSVELMTAKLIRVQDIVERIDATVVVQYLEPELPDVFSQVMAEAAQKEEKAVWDGLSERLKQELVNRAKKDSATVVRGLVEDLKNNIEGIFDLAGMVEDAFVKEPALLNHMFISCGYEELIFIRDFGAYMGGVFGVVQVTLYIFYPEGWTLPAFGFVVGLLTNWLALKMIFEPVEPRYICGLKLHGLFLQRQLQVSEVYAKIVADNILHAKTIIRAILKGRFIDRLFKILHQNVSKATDGYIGGADRLVKLFRTEDKIKRMKEVVSEIVLQRLPQDVKYIEKYMDEAMDLEPFLRDKLSSLPFADFEGLLHPVFQEDEWKLVLVGGVLGVIIGCAQWKALGS